MTDYEYNNEKIEEFMKTLMELNPNLEHVQDVEHSLRTLITKIVLNDYSEGIGEP